MRSITRLAGVVISLFFVIGANGGSGDLSGASDCPFDPHQVRTSRELWGEISARAELVAPPRAPAEAASTPGRRRAAQPPAYTPPAFTPKNFVDDEIFGKMLQDHIP